MGEDVTRQSVASLGEDIDDLMARLDEAEQTARTLPHRQKYLLLVSGFLRRLLELHLEFLAELESQLATDESTSRRRA